MTQYQSNTMARRLWSVGALLLMAGAVVLAVIVAVSGFPRGLSVLACLAVSLAALWYGIRRHGLARVAGLTVSAVLLIGAVVLVAVERRILEDVIVFAAFLAALYCARLAFRVRVRWPSATPPEHPVLFYNPLSGGGKATTFHLPAEARRRGIDPIELTRGTDLETLVRGAVADGADGLAMAGGDGSQAIVAKVAAELGLPYACIPAGTRNHFALDLGVDRDDVVGALDAFVDGGERQVDLAEVNGRVFVNNVSLGLYADAVQQPGYREAKLHTLLDAVPEALGPDARPRDMHWSGGREGDSAVAVLVSNDPYRLRRGLGAGTRPRLDRGVLGIAVLMPQTAAGNGAPKARLTTEEWTDTTFEVAASGAVAAGIDGEATQLDPPLRFRTRPDALRVRIAPDHPGVSPSAVEPDTPWQVVRALARFALSGEHGAAALPAAGG